MARRILEYRRAIFACIGIAVAIAALVLWSSYNGGHRAEQRNAYERTENPPTPMDPNNPDERIADYNFTLDILTLVLVIVGCVQAGVFFWQGHQLKRTVDSAERGMRPFLRPIATKKGRLFPDQDNRRPYVPEAEIMLENHGKTAAILKESQFVLILGPAVGPLDIPPIERWQDAGRGHVVTGETVFDGDSGWIVELRLGNEITINDIAEINQGRTNDPARPAKRFYLLGRVVYDDVFGWRTTQGFCIKLLREPGSQNVSGRTHNYIRRERTNEDEGEEAN